MIDRTALRVALARHNLAQWRLAQALGIPPSTFSDYIRGVCEPRPELITRMEQALGLSSGELQAPEVK